MADNSDSYTFLQYKKNKQIFRIIKFILGIGGLLLLIYFLLILQNKSLSTISIGVLSIFFIFAFKLLAKWDNQNNKDIQKNYHTWGKGAGAELSVMKALETLPPEYKIIPDFNTGHGNIDFIVIGPKGIFTIEVKASKGIITFQNSQVHIDERVPEQDYIRQTIAKKLWLMNMLSQQFSKKYPITSLLEFTNGKIDKTSIHGPIQGIWIGGYNFHTWLINKSTNYLSPEEIQTIYSFLSSNKQISQQSIALQIY